MNIKEKIGQRIEEQRKTLGYTLKELADLTDDLKQSRISNWERGVRTPGPLEIKQLAKALNVSAAYLMCLTDEKELDKLNADIILPLIVANQLNDFELFAQMDASISEYSTISINPEFVATLSKKAFATIMEDESMSPDIKMKDIVIIDPDKTPSPGNFVLVKIKQNNSVIIRRYKQLSINKFQEFELLPINENWPRIQLNSKNEGQIIGVVCGLFRNLF